MAQILFSTFWTHQNNASECYSQSTRTLLYQPVQELRSLTDTKFHSYGSLIISYSPCLASLCWSNDYFHMRTNHLLVCSSSNIHKHLLSWRRASAHYRLLALTHDHFSASTPRLHNPPPSWTSEHLVVPQCCQGCSYQAEKPEIHSVQSTGRAAFACPHPKSYRFSKVSHQLASKSCSDCWEHSTALLKLRPQYWPWKKSQRIIAQKAQPDRY